MKIFCVFIWMICLQIDIICCFSCKNRSMNHLSIRLIFPLNEKTNNFIKTPKFVFFLKTKLPSIIFAVIKYAALNLSISPVCITSVKVRPRPVGFSIIVTWNFQWIYNKCTSQEPRNKSLQINFDNCRRINHWAVCNYISKCS